MNNNNHILHNDNPDGIDRRGFLKCMAWAGTGVLWSLNGGVLTSRAPGQTTPPAPAPAAPPLPPPALGRTTPRAPAPAAPPGTLDFVQISDSHIGFKKPANPDVAATFRE